VARSKEDAKAVDPLLKIANTLALLAVKGLPSGEQIVVLGRARFTYQEIADLLGTTYQTVNQTLYADRKGLRKKPKKKNQGKG
jgi:DNA-directed RNA polymerase specialized sigma24 family protein